MDPGFVLVVADEPVVFSGMLFDQLRKLRSELRIVRDDDGGADQNAVFPTVRLAEIGVEYHRVVVIAGNPTHAASGRVLVVFTPNKVPCPNNRGQIPIAGMNSAASNYDVLVRVAE